MPHPVQHRPLLSSGGFPVPRQLPQRVHRVILTFLVSQYCSSQRTTEYLWCSPRHCLYSCVVFLRRRESVEALWKLWSHTKISVCTFVQKDCALFLEAIITQHKKWKIETNVERQQKNKAVHPLNDYRLLLSLAGLNNLNNSIHAAWLWVLTGCRGSFFLWPQFWRWFCVLCYCEENTDSLPNSQIKLFWCLFFFAKISTLVTCVRSGTHISQVETETATK